MPHLGSPFGTKRLLVSSPRPREPLFDLLPNIDERKFMFYQHKVSRLISEAMSVSERNSMVTISLVVLDILDSMAYMKGGYYVPIASI